MSLKPQNIRPEWDKVLIRQKKAEEKTSGGIILAAESQDRAKFQEIVGEVVSVGAGAFKDLYRDPEPPKKGDKVIFKRYAGNNFIDQFADSDEFSYRLISDTDIVALVTGDDNDD